MMKYSVFLRDFNPRSREGSDRNPIIGNRKTLISIHAPARGATTPEITGNHITRISIHAPARGATGIKFRIYPNKGQFQSTLPRGERPSVKFPGVSVWKFQSTLPRGERQTSEEVTGWFALFQSTLPRGERLLISI